MKAQNIIIAVILTITTATVSFANAPCRMLTFKDAMGREMFMPVKEDVAPEALPVEVAAEFRKARNEAVSQIFDLSSMTKPEQDVQDVDIDLDAVFKSLKKK